MRLKASTALARSTAPLGAALLALAGCQLEQLFAGDVGQGAARLTIANTGALLRLANEDPLCGFASPAASLVVSGAPGDLGTATWSIDGCVIDLGNMPVTLGTDCSGATVTASGLVVVSGTRTVAGFVTGQQDTPVVPQSADAVTIALAVDLWGLHVHMTGPGGANLLMKQGHMDIVAEVHLARSALLGVCSVPTDEITLRRIAVTNAVYVVDDGEGRTFKVPVPNAELTAQVGAYAGRENVIDGSITVWETTVKLDEQPLDPAYAHDAFVASFACTQDLKSPIDYTCPSLRPVLADGAAKLTVSTVGNIVSVFSKDTVCGLESPAVKAGVRLQGEVGREGGTATYVIAVPCVLDFGPQGKEVSRDCSGNPVTAYGKAAFTGTVTIRGRLTGNPAQPVIPLSRHAVDIDLRLELDGARITGLSPESMEVVRGTITGHMQPALAIDPATGACSLDLPMVTFDDLKWAAGTQAIIHTEALSLAIAIEGSSLQAQSGQRDGVENSLTGSIDVGDERITIPLEGNEPLLDPAYQRASYLACLGDLRVPASDEECNMHQIIGDGVARLVVQTVGTIAGLINEDDNCGYSNTLGVLANPSSVVGDRGEQGSLTWEIADCQVGNDALAVYATDCLGNTTWLAGHASVDSWRTVFGEREAALDLFLFAFGESIIPNDEKSIELSLDGSELHELSTYAIKAGESEPLGILTIHEGTLDAFVEPATAEANDGSGFTVPTPRAHMSGVRLRDARATLTAQGMTFVVAIDDTNIVATNGRLGLAENTIAGTVTIDGDVIAIGGSLDPDYDAARFDDSWKCNPLLAP